MALRYERSLLLDRAAILYGQPCYKKGAITILLLDGAAIADLLIDRGLGVRRLPLYLLDIDEEFFDLEND